VSKSKAGQKGDIVEVTFAKVGHFVSKQVDLPYGQTLRVNVPSFRDPDLAERFSITGLSLIGRKTKVDGDDKGHERGLNSFHLGALPGEGERLFSFSYVEAKRPEKVVFTALVTVHLKPPQ